MPEPRGSCSLFYFPVWLAAAFLAPRWYAESFRLLASSLAVKAVSLSLVRGVLDNFLGSAKYCGVCLT